MNRPDLADLAFAVLVIMIGVAPVLAVSLIWTTSPWNPWYVVNMLGLSPP